MRDERAGVIDLKKLGHRVAQLRERHRLSVQELADKIGLTYQSVWRLERGTQGPPKGNVLLELAKTFDISVDHLIGRYEDEESQ